MGWAYGIIEGKEVGYGVEAVCEHEGCGDKIDRGLAYACGGMAGEDEFSCNGFFCEKHLVGSNFPEDYGLTSFADPPGWLCAECEKRQREFYEEESGVKV